MAANKKFFYYSLCHYCKNFLETYQRCVACKSVSYCSQAHQKLDWKVHRKLCKAITLSRKRITLEKQCNFEEWKSYRIRCQFSWKLFLKRELYPYENQIWMFPRMCAVCYNEDNLKDCSKCYNVAYCSVEHMQQHKLIHNKFCRELKLCVDIDKYLSSGNCYPTINIELLNKFLCNVEDMEELLKLFNIEDEYNSDHVDVETALKAHAISPSAIIYNALKYIKLGSRDKLVIHIVGASAMEATLDWRLIYEVIFYHKPNLQEINFLLIGPEASDFSAKLNLNSVCLENGKTANLRVFANLYHEIVDILEVPDIIVAFNCGLHENENQMYNSWKSSLPAVIKNKETPFVFTSYTEDELVKDMECLTKLQGYNLKFLYHGKNPFASLRPVRDWSTKDIPVFYSNGYMAIIVQVMDMS